MPIQLDTQGAIRSIEEIRTFFGKMNYTQTSVRGGGASGVETIDMSGAA